MKLAELSFSDVALDNLKAIPQKLRLQILKKIDALEAIPKPQGCKQLKDTKSIAGEPIFRIRSGDYRVLYVVRTDQGEVLILDVGHRRDVYR